VLAAQLRLEAHKLIIEPIQFDFSLAFPSSPKEKIRSGLTQHWDWKRDTTVERDK
jgi:hypothetical protein